MHILTQQGQWEMRVDYQKHEKTWSYLYYEYFSIGSAAEEHPLTVGEFTGEGSDQFAYLNGMKFTTRDHDNNNDCATTY